MAHRQSKGMGPTACLPSSWLSFGSFSAKMNLHSSPPAVMKNCDVISGAKVLWLSQQLACQRLLTLAREAADGVFHVGLQPFSTTLFGVPFPHPTPQGRWAQRHRKVPESCVRRMHKAAFRTPRQHWQMYEERTQRDATRPEGRAAQPHTFCAAIVTSQPWIGFFIYLC